MKGAIVGLLFIACSSAAIGQTDTQTPTTTPQAVVQPQTMAVIEPMAQTNILRSGTEVPLVTREELTTRKKKLRVGQRFQMEVSSNVEANGVIVIPAGTPAVGEITEVRNKGMWGKSGYVGARAVSLRIGDRTIRLTGTFDDKGVTGTGGVVASAVLIPLAGFFTTGTSAMIPTGSAVKAFLDEDIAFRAVAAQPKVIEVPVVQAVPAPTTSTPQAAPPSE